MASTVHLEIVGLLSKPNFQIAKSIAEGLKNKFPDSFDDPTIRPLLECDWQDYLCNKKTELRGEVWQYRGCLMSFANGQLLGDERKLSGWAEKEWKFTFHRPQALYMALAEEFYTSNLRSTGHIFVYMDIESGGEAVGRLLFELFSDVCPKTCRNFKALCTGEAGLSKSNLELSYKSSIFHRVVPNGWLQGGDISPENKGTGGESIYGPTFEGRGSVMIWTRFCCKTLGPVNIVPYKNLVDRLCFGIMRRTKIILDENFVISHNKRGILGMANQGAHSNGSQFYITLQPATWMDHKYLAFGQLVEGTEVLKRLEAVPTYNERPKQDCKIIACGIFEF